MIPVIEAVGDEIDLIAFQGYNTGASTNRKIMHDAYAHYAAQYGFVVAAGVHYPPEPWGPFYEYTHENVADLSEHIYSHPNRGERNDGIMIWQLLLEGAESSAYSYLNTASKALTERLLLLRWKKLIFLLSSHIAGVHQAARKGRQGVLQPFVTLRSIILPINTLILELKLYTIVKFGKISGGSTRMNCLAQTTDGKKLEIVVKGNDVVNIKIATCKIVGYGKCILEEIS